MNQIYIKNTNYLTRGFITIIIGLIISLGNDELYINLLELLVIVISINVLYEFVKLCTRKQKKAEKKISIVNIVIGITYVLLMEFNNDIPVAILPIIFAAYVLLSGIIKFINFVLMIGTGAKGIFKELAVSSIFLVFGLTCLTSPIINLSNILIFIGGYLMLVGINDITDYFNERMPKKYRKMFSKIMRRKIRVSMPAVFEMFIPAAVLNKLNSMIEAKKDDASGIYDQEKVKNEKADMEIFIHAKPKGFGTVGHVDIYIDGKVYSYGNYDNSSYRLFNTVGDGVFFITNKKKYIEFCNTYAKKTIFVFGLKLTKLQKENILKQIEKIQKDLYKWEPPECKGEEDYTGNLKDFTHVDFFKFTRGRFKRYFMLETNCVLLADSIIGKAGTDILKVAGFITPRNILYIFRRRILQEKRHGNKQESIHEIIVKLPFL
ncbi:MAG: DUF308 domain-containing protein [Clostridia bacterium]